MLSAWNSKDDLHLIFRIFSFEVLISNYIYLAIYDANLKYYFYFTNWGLLLSSIYFFLTLLSYKKNVARVQQIFFLIIWAFNWSITSAYWGYLFPIAGSKTIVRSSIIHSVPLILTLIEFLVYNIKVKRIDFIYPMCCLLFYQLCLLMPFTLLVRPLYSEITFDSILSFGICIGLLLVAYIMLEVLKLFKDHMLKSKNKTVDQVLDQSWGRRLERLIFFFNYA